MPGTVRVRCRALTLELARGAEPCSRRTRPSLERAIGAAVTIEFGHPWHLTMINLSSGEVMTKVDVAAG